MKFKFFLFSCILFSSSPSFSTEKPTLRLAVLAFGTVNWELATLKNQQLLAGADFQLEITPISNPQAGKIALQSGAVDMIVSDWIWVSRLRSTGADFTFYPYSTTSGALVVPENSTIKSVTDLQGKKLGIAGGELDKNWLLLQTLALQKKQLNLSATVDKIYGAPPLLNQQLLHQRIDAVINYWHFAAKLEAQGYRQLINGQQILQQLGIQVEVPTLGYVFNRDWGLKNPTIIKQFLIATQQAKNLLCDSDKAWQQVTPLTKAKDTLTENKLRERYCAGRIKQWGEAEQQAAAKIYQLLRQLSHNKLTGQAENIQAGTFWNIQPQ